MSETRTVLRPVDPEAVRLAKTLIRTARHGALATVEPGSLWPLATRVGVATDSDGTPTILVSALAAHTGALRTEPRCSLLLGEPGKGDPLAHARISLACTARMVERGRPELARVSTRYLSHQPKAELYATLPDFDYFRLEIASASLNAGFGRAFAMTPSDVVSADPVTAEVASMEADVLHHMNADHPEAVEAYARHFLSAGEGRWRLAGIDAEGMTLANGDDVRRIFFASPLPSAAHLRDMLMDMARQARAG